MTITELGAIGELVGGVAVIATLIYLAVQIRQGNERAKREASSPARWSFPAALCALGEDGENAEVLRSGFRDFAALTPQQALRFNSILLGLFAAFVVASDNRGAGLIPADEFEATEGNFLRFILTPGGREWWDQTKHLYPARGVVATEDALANRSVDPITASWPFLAS